MRDFQSPGRSAVYATNGMCATSHPLAAKTAIDVLQSGGNAMDAAIAGAVLLGFCEPQMTGIGGDCFVLWSPAGSEDVKALNGSGRAAQAVSASDLRGKGLEHIPLHGADAVTIPCAVDAFCHLAGTEGRIGLDRILAPAIYYAETGIPVAPRVALDWAQQSEALAAHGRHPMLPPLNTGSIYRAPKQAEALKRIARKGRDAFYTGEIAEDMCTALKTKGGVQTMDDFAAAKCETTTPISGHYKGLELLEHPPNGSGAVAILMLNILSHFDLASMSPNGALRAHIEAEAAKLAYDARDRFIADQTPADVLDHMLSHDTAKALADLIKPDQTIQNPIKTSQTVHKDTVYITVVDQDRMAVSLIYSIYHPFGSGIISPKFGILMHNRGAGFNLIQGHPNELGPLKRPMHTIIPAILRENGKVRMPFGVMGGAYQPNGHARLITNLADYGMDLQSAIDAPRSFSDGGKMELESSYPDAVRQSLTNLGQNPFTPIRPIGGAQAIYIRDDGVLVGASDPRKDGCAIGY